MNLRLLLVVQLLLPRQRPVRRRDRLYGKRSGDAVLILAELIGQMVQLAGDCLFCTSDSARAGIAIAEAHNVGLAIDRQRGSRYNTTLRMRKIVSYGRQSQCNPTPNPRSAA